MGFGRRKRKFAAERITLNLASMIDVTFLLLIYFMVTMVFARPEDKLGATLKTETENEAGPSSDFQPQIIEVLTQGGEPVYMLGRRVLRTRDDLRDALESLPKTEGVFVTVHDRVPVGFAVTAIQIARDVGFDQVTYVPAE